MMYDTGTTSPQSVTGKIDINQSELVYRTPLTEGEIVAMLLDARRTIAAQDKLIKELQEEYAELEKDYEILEDSFKRVIR